MSLLGTWDNGRITWLANARPLDSQTDWSQLASHNFFSSHLTDLYLNSLYRKLWWRFPDFQNFYVAVLISLQDNFDPSASFWYKGKANKRRKTKKHNFISFSWLGKKWEPQIKQHSKISKSLCKLGKTCNYSLRPNSWFKLTLDLSFTVENKIGNLHNLSLFARQT